MIHTEQETTFNYEHDTMFSHWNNSVKISSLFTQWQLLPDYDSLFRVMRMRQDWVENSLIAEGDNLLQQLLEQWPINDRRARIWASFHIGPYVLLSRALIQQGMGVAILLKDEVYEEQHEVYINSFRQYFGHDPSPNELRFIRTDNSNSLIKLKQALQEGLHVICFIDGKEGGYSANSKVDVQVYNSTFQARLGIAILSRWAKTPVRPIILTLQEEKLKVYSPTDYWVDSPEAGKALLQNCYNLLQKLDISELVQWDGLLGLIQEKVEQNQLKEEPEEEWMIDRAFWIPIFVQGKHLVVDLHTGKGKSIPADLHRRLYEMFQDKI